MVDYAYANQPPKKASPGPHVHPKILGWLRAEGWPKKPIVALLLWPVWIILRRYACATPLAGALVTYGLLHRGRSLSVASWEGAGTDKGSMGLRSSLYRLLLCPGSRLCPWPAASTSLVESGTRSNARTCILLVGSRLGGSYQRLRQIKMTKPQARSRLFAVALRPLVSSEPFKLFSSAPGGVSVSILGCDVCIAPMPRRTARPRYFLLALRMYE
jgi:hypothetical protein